MRHWDLLLNLFMLGAVIWVAWALTYNVRYLEWKIELLKRRLAREHEAIRFIRKTLDEDLEDRVRKIEIGSPGLIS